VAAHARLPYLEGHPLQASHPSSRRFSPSHAGSPIQAAAHKRDRPGGYGAWDLAASPGASAATPMKADNGG
jgi:hypothetical protein